MLSSYRQAKEDELVVLSRRVTCRVYAGRRAAGDENESVRRPARPASEGQPLRRAAERKQTRTMLRMRFWPWRGRRKRAEGRRQRSVRRNGLKRQRRTNHDGEADETDVGTTCSGAAEKGRDRHSDRQSSCRGGRQRQRAVECFRPLKRRQWQAGPISKPPGQRQRRFFADWLDAGALAEIEARGGLRTARWTFLVKFGKGREGRREGGGWRRRKGGVALPFFSLLRLSLVSPPRGGPQNRS